MTRFLYAALFAGFITGTFAGEVNNASETLDRAVRLYKAGNYNSTIEVIRDFLKANGKDPAAEQLVPLIMEAFLRTGEYASVHRLYDLYNKKYRSSPFMPRVYYLRGYAFAREGSWLESFEYFSKALDAGVSGEIDSIIITGCEAICRDTLDEDDLHDACKDRGNHPRIKEIACYYELQSLLASGSANKARKRMNNFKNSFPDSRFDLSIGDQLPPPVSKNTVVVGVLAPLTGEDAEVGRRVTQGIQLAIDKHNQRGQIQVRLVPYDTKGQLIETARKTVCLIDTNRAAMILGPMLSPTATVAAAMVRDQETVLLTPTATDEGIAGIAPNIFQMNITIGVQSSRAARYALSNLNIKEYTIIAPNTAFGTAMAGLFREEVEKNGGTIFAEQFYEEGANDFSGLFSELRKKLILSRMNQMRGALDKKPVLKVSYTDSLKWVDSSFSLGAIFMPGEADDIVMLAPQVAFNRIKAQLIGSSGWYSSRTLSVGKQYVQNAIISTPFEPDTSWKKWPDFRREYIKRFREEPDRVAALGFDAASLAALAIENSGGSGKASRIAGALSEIQNYEGTSGVISFDPAKRTNTEAVILKITQNRFVRVQ
jgi:ABC-type branched-subunit amino acid transport system substrate-binding protein